MIPIPLMIFMGHGPASRDVFLAYFSPSPQVGDRELAKKKNRGESMTRENAEMNPVRDKDEG